MSLQAVREMVVDLPYALRDQIIGYAESVDRAAPEIFASANRKIQKTTSDQLVFIAGVKKLHAIAASSYWTLDNSGKLLEGLDIESIKIGGRDFSRGSPTHHRLKQLLDALDKAIGPTVASYFSMSWVEVIQALSSNERSAD